MTESHAGRESELEPIPRVEALVAEFLEAREADPTLSACAFAGRYPNCYDPLLSAIESTLAVLELLPRNSNELKSIGRFSVVRELGRGGMGVVYEVRDGGQRYALKLLPLAPYQGQRALERFRRELTILSRLAHPGIVRVVDSGTHNELPYFVMDLIEGQTLDRAASEGGSARRHADDGSNPSLPAPGNVATEQVLDWLIELADTVAAAHEQGVVHRDLKPQNVMVSDGRLMLLDFGLGAAEEFPTLTSTGDVLGSPRYLSPEQAKGEAIDGRVDVYGIGAIGFELLAGRPAFDQPHRASILRAVIEGDRPHLGLLRPDLGHDLVIAIERALALIPEQRYSSVRLLHEDLTRCRTAAPSPFRLPLLQRFMRRLTGSLRRSLTIKGVPPRDREHELQLLHRAIEAWSDQRHDAAREILSRVHADTRQRQPLLGVLEVALSSDLHVQAKSTPNDALIRGLSLREQGLHEGAFDELSRVEDPALLPLARLARGLSALHSKRWRLAESDLTSVASVFPGSAAVMGGIALARMRQGRPDVALAELELLVRLTPESASAWRAMGETLKELDRIDEAWSALSRAESIEPHDSPDNSVLRASIWARQQRTEDACRLLESVVKQAPNHAGAWRELALARDTSHQVVEAAVAYRRALELNPDDPLILMCFANLCVGADIGRCARCDECFAKNPELIDHVAAQDLLIRSLVATRDENVALLDSIQYVALKLESRGQLLQQLDEVVATCSDSTAQLRLHSLRRQLKLREP